MYWSIIKHQNLFRFPTLSLISDHTQYSIAIDLIYSLENVLLESLLEFPVNKQIQSSYNVNTTCYPAI